jgi:hypothetical protein
VLTREHDPCEDEIVKQLGELLARQVEYRQADGEDFFDAAQNARIVRAAEQYYRVMYRGSTESWNLRDRHMFETLQHLLEQGGPQAKVVVWAHNSHIGDASATEMGWRGEFNIGELCKTAYRDAAMLIGFGTVMAADDWDAPLQGKPCCRRGRIPTSGCSVPPARHARSPTCATTGSCARRWRGHGWSGPSASSTGARPSATATIRGRAARAVRRLCLVRADECGDAAADRATAWRAGDLSVRDLRVADMARDAAPFRQCCPSLA